MLDAEPFVASASPARLHFIADEDAAVLANDRDSLLEILFGRDDEAARARNRLGHKCGDLTRGRGLDQLLHIFGAGDAAFGIGEFQRAAITVWRQGVMIARHLRGQNLPRLLSRRRQRRRRTPAVAVTQGYDLLPASVEICAPRSGFVGLSHSV